MYKIWLEKHLYVIWVNTGILKAATMSTTEMKLFCEIMSFSYGSIVLFSKMQWLWNELFISKIIFSLSAIISRSHLEIFSCHCFGGRSSCSPWESYSFFENDILTCILSCKNWIASLCLMQDTACLELVHGDDPERCYGEGGGRGFMFGNACKN